MSIMTVRGTCNFVTSAMTLLIVFGGIGGVAAQQRATFQDSCSNIRYEERGGMAGIAATCKSASGASKESFVVIKGIDNTEGKLTHTAGNNPATFQKSCRDTSIQLAGSSGVTLASTCRTSAGNYLQTATSIWDLNNIDGNLKYPY